MKVATRLLTTAEVAAILRCSERTIRWRAIAGQLEYVRPMGTKRFLFRESYIRSLLSQTDGVTGNN